ncbi:hypothetical protein GGP84_003038 [Salinibacter ruber]|nr:hypothetical protein [Salinibacter ruber]
MNPGVAPLSYLTAGLTSETNIRTSLLPIAVDQTRGLGASSKGLRALAPCPD